MGDTTLLPIWWLAIDEQAFSVNYAPVALFVYNRPDHTRRVIKSLSLSSGATETALYIFSDAPKNAEASRSVTEVRSCIRDIDGFKSVTIIEREKNWGLAKSIINGVSLLCDKYEQVIVVEDDLVVSKAFLTYMNKALSLYLDEENVMQIAGYMFPMNLDVSDDALFLPFISSWGWATWKRAWQHFDPEARQYQKLIQDATLRNRFDLNGNYRYFKMLEAQQMGKSESWAIRWYLSVFMRDGLALYPKKSLVRNDGFDGSGVNCAVSDIETSELSESFSPVVFPERIEVTGCFDSVLKNMPRPRLSISSIINRLRSLLRKALHAKRVDIS